MDNVLQFDEIDSSMIDAVGGKALNLGIMTAAGLPVPGGFCVSTSAYGQVVGAQLDDLISDLASTTQPAELARLADPRPATGSSPARCPISSPR